MVVIEPLYPMLSHKLPVSQETVNAFRPEQLDVAIQQVFPFLSVRCSLLRKHAEQ